MTPGRPTLDDSLQRTLQPEPAPGELRERLLREARRRDRPHFARHRWLGAAALVLLAAGVGWGLLGSGAPTGPRLAQAALSEFVEGHALDFQGAPGHPCSEPSCRAWSKTALGFEAPLPKEAADCPLQGGRACRVRGLRAACYLLKDGRSVFVFEKPIPKLGSDPRTVLAVGAGFQARAWNEGGVGLVMVEPQRP